MEFNAPHLHILERSAPGSWLGARIPSSWFNSIGYVTRSNLPESVVCRAADRENLRQIARDANIDTLDVCMLVFAWGGMTVKNAKGVLQKLS